jgi:uncharacterized cupin superfamily protein
MADHQIQGQFITGSTGSMSQTSGPPSIVALDAEARGLPPHFPAAFVPLMRGRRKRILGDLFGLANFGVNLTRLGPGDQSALLHAHALQDEFIYIVAGHPTLVTSDGETQLAPGHCAGFKAGGGLAHHLVNRGSEEVLFLEVGDRTPGDSVHYPNDDVRAEYRDGRWTWLHKDGSPYA